MLGYTYFLHNFDAIEVQTAETAVKFNHCKAILMPLLVLNPAIFGFERKLFFQLTVSIMKMKVIPTGEMCSCIDMHTHTRRM